MTFKPPPHLPVRINGSRNQVAPFKTRMGVLTIGGMAPIAALGESSVLLTAEAERDHDDGFVDVEIAIPVSLIDQVIELIQARREECLRAPALPTEAPSLDDL
ncbi:MAG TPA: hypothetical protein VNO30_18345 [Kofleriaceae bacterium]|nr:hypothetical protein [Kofleriaceae bacterium]